MAIQAKYLKKIRNGQGNIVGYTIVDRKRREITISSNDLKQLIREGQLELINLTLTTDNRLVDKGKGQPEKPKQRRPGRPGRPGRPHQRKPQAPQAPKRDQITAGDLMLDLGDKLNLIIFNHNKTKGETSKLDDDFSWEFMDKMWDIFNDRVDYPVIGDTLVDKEGFMDIWEYTGHYAEFLGKQPNNEDKYNLVRALIKRINGDNEIDMELFIVLTIQSLLLDLNVKHIVQGERLSGDELDINYILEKEIGTGSDKEKELDRLILKTNKELIEKVYSNNKEKYGIQDYIKIRELFKSTAEKLRYKFKEDYGLNPMERVMAPILFNGYYDNMDNNQEGKVIERDYFDTIVSEIENGNQLNKLKEQFIREMFNNKLTEIDKSIIDSMFTDGDYVESEIINILVDDRRAQAKFNELYKDNEDEIDLKELGINLDYLIDGYETSTLFNTRFEGYWDVIQQLTLGAYGKLIDESVNTRKEVEMQLLRLVNYHVYLKYPEVEAGDYTEEDIKNIVRDLHKYQLIDMYNPDSRKELVEVTNKILDNIAYDLKNYSEIVSNIVDGTVARVYKEIYG